jgi:tellurite resistance protein TerC
MFYVFGAFLIVTGIRMALHKEEEIDPEHNPLIRLCCRLFPMTKRYHGAQFAAYNAGRWRLTPLALVLVMVESTDLLFALDSIPAIIAITQDKFIIYTSNVCAILGLRSLYFLLAAVVAKFAYLRFGLAAILTFVGIKMLVADWYPIATHWSLGVVAPCLAAAIAASLWFPPKEGKK